MQKQLSKAIKALIKKRRPSSPMVEQVIVKQYNKLPAGKCCQNAITLAENHPTEYSVVSGWLLTFNKEYNDVEIIAHYWNVNKVTNQMVDTTTMLACKRVYVMDMDIINYTYSTWNTIGDLPVSFSYKKCTFFAVNIGDEITYTAPTGFSTANLFEMCT